MLPLIILAGPTAVGKTAASIGLAKALHGEILSGDSMQIFRGLDIGTAKITPQEMEGIPHHLIDIKDPWESFSVAEFQSRADISIQDICQRGKVPILVGGTGFYINSVLYSYHMGETDADPAYRKELQTYCDTYGKEALWKRLQKQDAPSAARLHVNDTKRIIRALEVLHTTGIPASQRSQEPDRKAMRYQAIYFVLNLPRPLLYNRINHRVEDMMQQGLLRELQQALANGTPEDALSMTSLGYRQLISYLHGTLSLEEAVEQIKRDTRHFAKRQLTWFRHDPNVQWIEKEGKDDAQIREELLKRIRSANILPTHSF